MTGANIIFPELKFNKAGTYTYTVKELTPATRDWLIDRRDYRVVIHVTDNGKGALLADVDYPDGCIEFCNIFKDDCLPAARDKEICEAFMCMPFPLFLFMPPQEPEFNKIMVLDPNLFERWNGLFFSEYFED